MEGTVEPQPLRIGWNVPGTFTRLAMHLGMIMAWLRYFPKHLPSLVVATSAGAIIMACCITFDAKVLARVRKLILGLKREQIYTYSPGLIKTGVHLLIAGGVFAVTMMSVGSLGWQWAPLLFPLTIAAGFARLRLSRAQFFAVCGALVICTAGIAWKTQGWASASIFGVGLFLVDWLGQRAHRAFFKETGSPLDNTPLRTLLWQEEVPQSALGATTELRILATDVSVPESIIYSNHEPRMCDPTNQLHCEQFLDGAILGSSALPGRFPLRTVRGKTPRDGEVWTDYPVNQFVEIVDVDVVEEIEGVRQLKRQSKRKPLVDVIFRFDYWPPLMPGQTPSSWLVDLFRSFDVMRDKNTREKMARYELERQADPSLPRVVNIRASERLQSNLSELAIYNFKPAQLRRAMAHGMRIVRQNRELIRAELGLPQYVPSATNEEPAA